MYCYKITIKLNYNYKIVQLLTKLRLHDISQHLTKITTVFQTEKLLWQCAFHQRWCITIHRLWFHVLCVLFAACAPFCCPNDSKEQIITMKPNCLQTTIKGSRAKINYSKKNSQQRQHICVTNRLFNEARVQGCSEPPCDLVAMRQLSCLHLPAQSGYPSSSHSRSPQISPTRRPSSRNCTGFDIFTQVN